MVLLLFTLLACCFLDGSNSKSSMNNKNKVRAREQRKRRNRERRRREKYWEDAHWWSLNH